MERVNDLSSSPIVLAASRLWRPDLSERVAARIQRPCILIREQAELTLSRLRELQPSHVFFPHWSHRIPEEIFESFECIIFHMTDLPYGRGGSPLQNLIASGHTDTVLCALRCVKEIDAGPVYLRRPLSLAGTAQEIYIRATDLIVDMVRTIVVEQPIPQTQSGPVTKFRRRSAADSEWPAQSDLQRLHDHIRMLDADGYPRSFVRVGGYRIEFSRSSYRGDHVIAD
ncbi:MAG: hypothetical protein NZM00_10225, partial [Anaerolinea sp.]|nr:hypothetical protein [Anaerolinea sp.]